MTELTGKIEAVKQREKGFSIRIGDTWFSGWGLCTSNKGDTVYIDYETTDEGYHNIDKLEIKEKAKPEEKIERQKTLTPEQYNMEFNRNRALMTRCFSEAFEIVKNVSPDGYPNPEVVGRTAISLFLSLVNRQPEE